MAGCAREASRGVEAPPTNWTQAESASVSGTAPPASPVADFPGASPAPAPAAAQEAERSPAQRPGLGTEWGETLVSQVHETPFDRATADPFAIASVRYDDRPGVEALAARHPDFVRSRSSVGVGNGWIAMSVLGDGGAPLETVRAGDRTYVVGRAGERYTIVLSNQTRRRFEAVATVDGLDVMNGRAGNVSNRGYLLDPHATLQIEGFRQSDDTVAAFRFGRVADSYAAQTGSARDVGVIGVAFFAERRDRAREVEARYRDTATPFPADDRYAQPPR